MAFPSGINFPFRFSPAGGVGLIDAGSKVKANLKALILSATNERVIRKDVGTVGYRSVFRQAVRSGLLDSLVREAIQKFEPRAAKVTVSSTEKEVRGEMSVFVKVGYIFTLSGQPDTLTVELQ